MAKMIESKNGQIESLMSELHDTVADMNMQLHRKDEKLLEMSNTHTEVQRELKKLEGAVLAEKMRRTRSFSGLAVFCCLALVGMRSIEEKRKSITSKIQKKLLQSGSRERSPL